MKYCPRCNSEKEIELFNKGTGSQGRAGYCKKCSSEYKKEKANGKSYYGQSAETRKKYLIDNSERLKANAKIYYEKNKEKKLEESKKCYIKRRDSGVIRIYNRKYGKLKRSKDPMFKLKNNLRSRVYYLFMKKGFIKEKTFALLGANVDIVKKYIEKQFTKGMTWDNYGEWEVDHKIPLASAKNEDDLKSLFHYRNLQPLWGIDNRRKGDSIVSTQLSIAV